MKYIQRIFGAMLFALASVPALQPASAVAQTTAQGQAPAQGQAQAPAASPAADPRLQDMVLGKPDAPITIIEYASLTCPHCANFHATILPTLKTDYIETGKLRLIFRDFPLDQLAFAGAALARCAGPERYFSFLEVLYAQQRQWATSADPRAALVQIGRLGGMSSEQVEACFADQAVGDYIVNSRLEGNQKFNVNSTPTLIVNGKVVPGVPAMDEFRQLLDSLVKNGAVASPSSATSAVTADGSGFFAGNMKTYITIAVVVLIVGGIVFFLLRKR